MNEVFIHVGGLMDSATWFMGSKESEETLYSFIQTSNLLKNYPNYGRLFRELKMPEICTMVGRIEFLTKALNKMFSFEVEFVTPGTLLKLHEHDKDMYMYRYYHGHIYSKKSGSKDMLKIESVDKKIRFIDFPKALYEYGQMINHQVTSLEAESGNYFHNTSAYYASLLMGYDEAKGETEENVWALAFGNQLSGWFNAMWLAWILDIDQHALIMAMVLLEIDEIEDDDPPEFAEYIWLKYKDYVLDREFANQHFKHTGPYDLDDLINGQQIQEAEICQQIDKASALLFQIMILNESFRQAEERYVPFNNGEVCIKH